MADLLLAQSFKLGFNTSTFDLTYQTRNWGRQNPFTVWVAIVGAEEPCLQKTEHASHSSWTEHQSPGLYTVKINVQGGADWSSHFKGLKAKEGTGFPTVVYVFEEGKCNFGSDSTWITLDAWYGGYAKGIGMVRVNWGATPVFASKVIPYAGSVNDWMERQRWLVGWAKPTRTGVELEFLAPYDSSGTLELDWRKTKRVDAIYPFVPSSPSVDNIQLEVKGCKLRNGVSLLSYLGNTFFEHVSLSEIGLGISVAGTVYDIFSGSGGRTGLVTLPTDRSAIKIDIKIDCTHGWTINDDLVEIRVVCLTVFPEGVPELHGEHSASLVPPLPL